MKYIIIILLLFLSSCAHAGRCVDVSYFDFGSQGRFQALHVFHGTLYDTTLPDYDGLVIVDKYLGEGASKFGNKYGCEEKLDLQGWYAIVTHLPNDEGAWVLDGRGWGKMGVVVIPNFIPQKHLKEITQ
ncbi:MAG TPA: hypothetical protein ENH31_00480 [Nitrospirae bacterium]|nr:hypothetical protein [Nitrospirota bacterium]HDK81028.1 hypothetical protein [Nitrospirota bacterium]